MVRRIAGFLEVNEGVERDFLAVCLLNYIEDAGMLPPSIPTNASGWEIGKGASSHINEWEPDGDL